MTKNNSSNPESLEHRILGLLRAKNHAVHAGELRKLLVLERQDHPALVEQLSRMAEAGLVTELPGAKYRAPRQAPRNRIPQPPAAATSRDAPARRTTRDTIETSDVRRAAPRDSRDRATIRKPAWRDARDASDAAEARRSVSRSSTGDATDARRPAPRDSRDDAATDARRAAPRDARDATDARRAAPRDSRDATDARRAAPPRDSRDATDARRPAPPRDSRDSSAARRPTPRDSRDSGSGGRRPPPRGRTSSSGGNQKSSKEPLTGRLSMHARGFGFISPDETGPDIFIPPHALGNALNGDRVKVRVFPSPKGFDGQVIEVLERALHYIGGQLQIVGKNAFIEPDDERLKARVQVVGPLPEGAHAGQGVIAKVVGYPETPGEPLLASVIEAFEAAEFADFEIRRILLSQNVQEDFAEEVSAEAQAYGDHVTPEEIEGREDFRDIELLTIDPDDARDHDDAVFAERLSDGGYRVVVAIADVSHYVRPGTLLDTEALARGCTIYLPPRAIPMLPRELSSELASLLPKVDRLALAVDVELDKTGHVRDHRFVEIVMRSAARLSYSGVARALGLTEEPEIQPEAESRRPQLQTLLDVAKLLGAQRKTRGSLDFDLPEAKVKLDPETREPIDIVRSRTDPGVRAAYNMIEEMMLLANETVARDLSERKVAAIYRVHGAPNEEKVLAFAELARSLGFKIDDDVAERPGELARFLASVAETPHAEVLGFLLLRSMQQATYQTENIGHFGLAAEDYVHFTSPIRRYPDLAVHRVVRKIARGEQLHGKKLKSDLQEQAVESSRLERRAMLIEREVVDLYRAMLMRDRVGEEFSATITGITEHGIFAAIEAPCVDVFCRLAALPFDSYQTDRFGTRLVGLHSGTTYALFDKLTVRIEDVSVARRRVSAIPVHVEAGEEPVQHRAPSGARVPRPKPRNEPIRSSAKGRPSPERPRRHKKDDQRGGGGQRKKKAGKARR